MIDKNLTIEIHDDKFKSLLSMRGAFPVNTLELNTSYKDWLTGCTPSTGDHYLIVDVLRVISNLKRYNFVELIFGLPKKEIDLEKSNKLF
jgi:hypothetical protein